VSVISISNIEYDAMVCLILVMIARPTVQGIAPW
jgi:hypothetical protein